MAEGRFLEAAGDLPGAVAAYERAIAAQPHAAAGYVALGSVLYFAAATGEARAALDAGLARVPGSLALLWCRTMTELPMVLTTQDEARTAKALYSARLIALRRACAADPVRAAEAVGIIPPICLPYITGGADVALHAYHGRLVADVMAAAFPRWARPLRRPAAPGERIRVGIVAGTFSRHTVWRVLVRSWVEGLNRDRFKLFGYHTRNAADDQTAYAATLFDRFTVGARPVAEWAALIERDAPHVLIYPAIGLEQPTWQIAGLRLAPMQCASWGHPVTTGLPTIDAYLSSEAMEPADGADHYTERLVRLPGLGSAWEPSWAAWGDPLPDGDTWAKLGLPEGAVRFLCGQNWRKYLPADDDLFAQIATEVPQARFLFIWDRDQVRAAMVRRLDAAFARFGLSAETFCRWIPACPPAMFSALTRDADVFLDTSGWSGCNTSLDALGHGTPIITLPGALMRGRHSLAILTLVGVTDTVARDKAHYIALAVRLARDADWRREISARMQAGAPRAFDGRAAVRGLAEWLSASACAGG